MPEDVAGVYTPAGAARALPRGEKRVYTYELIDEFDDPGLTNPEANFGLLRRDLSPKPAYTAMKNLLGPALRPRPGVHADGAAGQGHRLPERREVRPHPEAQRPVRRAAVAGRLDLRPGHPAAAARHADQRDPAARQGPRASRSTAPRRAPRRSPRRRAARCRSRWTARSRRSPSTRSPAPAPDVGDRHGRQRVGHRELAAAGHRGRTSPASRSPASRARPSPSRPRPAPSATPAWSTAPATPTRCAPCRPTGNSAGRRGTAACVPATVPSAPPSITVDARGLGQRHGHLEGPDQQRRLADHRPTSCSAAPRR